MSELPSSAPLPADLEPIGREPDVTVIIPTYNAMPYLRRCIDSVVEQSLGLDRLQVVAVDDGSTDGSGALLDATAALHPDSFLVLHQPNSGGPALPCNRALDHAEGRWVFFLGADDYLGATALECLLKRGEEWGSDVIFGTMRGENGRFVDQRIFRRSSRDVDFSNAALAYSLSNTKLFRRTLIDEHRIRFALDLRVASDQPFVVEALTRARRVSVLTDQIYYHAVKRSDASNITYAMDWRTRLADTAAVMGHIAEVLEPGPTRDAIYCRHFTWEISKLLRRDLPRLPAEEQAELIGGVANVFDRYDTAGLDERLGPRTRLRLRLAQSGQADLLREVLDYQEGHRRPPLALRSGGCYRWMPGFGTATVSNDWYRISAGNPGKQIVDSLKLSEIGADDGAIKLTGRIGLTKDSADELRVALMSVESEHKVPGPRTHAVSRAPMDTEFPVRLLADGAGQPADLTVTVPLAGLLSTQGPVARRWAIRLRYAVGQISYDLPVPWQGSSNRRVLVRGWNGWTLGVGADRGGNLLIVVERISRRRALRVRLDRARRSIVDGSKASAGRAQHLRSRLAGWRMRNNSLERLAL